MINTFVATAAAALAWMVAERMSKGKPSLLGGASGAVAGLVAVTPASGFAGPMGAIVLGIVAGVVCMFFCSAIKNALGYDDALDVFGVHCIGGIIGAIGTGILAAPSLGGTGVFDYTTGKVGDYDMVAQVIVQAKTVCLTLVWSGVGSAILFTIVQGARRPAARHRPGARGSRPRRSRRARLQLLRLACGAARAPSGLAALSEHATSPVRAPVRPKRKLRALFIAAPAQPAPHRDAQPLEQTQQMRARERDAALGRRDSPAWPRA